MLERTPATARAAVAAAIVVSLAATSVPLRAQHKPHVGPFWSPHHNPVSRIGAATSTGALLGLSVTLAVLIARAAEPDSAPSMQVARWSFVAGTFGGFAVGALWDLAAPSDPRSGSISAGTSALVGGLGGVFLGAAFPFALYRNPPTGLAVGSLWTGVIGGSIAGYLAGRSGSSARLSAGEAAINIVPGRGLSLAVPMPTLMLSRAEAPRVRFTLLSYGF